MPASCAHEHGSCTPHPLPNYQETFQLLCNPHEYDAPLVAEANISSGDTLDVVYTDGHVSEFSVSEIASELEGELVPVQVVEQEALGLKCNWAWWGADAMAAGPAWEAACNAGWEEGEEEGGEEGEEEGEEESEQDYLERCIREEANIRTLS